MKRSASSTLQPSRSTRDTTIASKDLIVLPFSCVRISSRHYWLSCRVDTCTSTSSLKRNI
eukprot:scaffold8210_cov175-Amphora_coffeaeformis.AAC.1